ncbi:MAG: ATP-binding protein [Vicinamibacteraceae bacterium]
MLHPAMLLTSGELLDGVRILIVEDEILLAVELADRLAGFGATVVDSVDSGAAALAAAETHRPDVVLMDVRLKGAVDGIDTALQIQERVPVAVVFLTAHSDTATLDRARRAGAYGFLSKPVRERDICSTISTALERHRLERRAHELNARLVEQAQLLEAKNRELDEFASIVSHDLRAPLRNLRMLLDLLGDEPLSGDTADIVQRARNNGRRMATLIDSLLDLARAGSAAMRCEDHDLAALCDDVIGDLGPAIGESGAIIARPEPGLTVTGDAALLRQLLQNLLSNALKFRRDGVTPAIAIDGRATADAGLELVVRDNGPGFDPQHARRLFQRFARLSMPTPVEGVGIGLATCARIVERHGGSIHADATPGAGAAFTVRLPARTQPPDTSSPPAPAS